MTMTKKSSPVNGDTASIQNTPPITVALFTTNTVFRCRFKAVCNNHARIDMIKTEGTLIESLIDWERQRQQPELVVIDYPSNEIINTITKIQDLNQITKILVAGNGEYDLDAIYHYFSAGASGYVHKNAFYAIWPYAIQVICIQQRNFLQLSHHFFSSCVTTPSFLNLFTYQGEPPC